MAMRRAAATSTGAPAGVPNSSAGSTNKTPTKRRKRKRTANHSSTSNKRRSSVVGLISVTFLSLVMAILYWKHESRLELRRQQHQQASAKALLLQNAADKPITFQISTPDAPDCNNLRDEIEFTLVTQLSVDRLWMMQHHCERWPGRISIAVLTNATRDETLQRLQQQDHCSSSLLIVQTMQLTPERDLDYPANTLRMMALSAVTTSHVVYVDIDFWPSHDLHSTLHSLDIKQSLSEDSKLALVVPAFQLHRQCLEWADCRQDNIPLMPKTQHDLLQLFREQKASPFDPTNQGGHGSTLYKEWVMEQQQQGDEVGDGLLQLPCIKSNRYEPYLAFQYCSDLPPFQQAFTGYGKNKMTWVMQLRRSGYQLMQVPHAFVVHYPHLDSASRMEWNKGAQGHLRKPDSGEELRRYKRGQVDALFIQFKKWLNEKIPDETRIFLCEDAQDDDAKLWVEKTS